MIYGAVELDCINVPNVPQGCAMASISPETAFYLPTRRGKLMGFQWQGLQATCESTRQLAAGMAMLKNPEYRKSFQQMEPQELLKVLRNTFLALAADNPCFVTTMLADGRMVNEPLCPLYKSGNCDPVIAKHNDSYPFPICIPHASANTPVTMHQDKLLCIAGN